MAKKYKVGKDINEVVNEYYSKDAEEARKESERIQKAVNNTPGLVRFKGDWKQALIAVIVVFGLIFILAIIFAFINGQIDANIRNSISR